MLSADAVNGMRTLVTACLGGIYGGRPAACCTIWTYVHAGGQSVVYCRVVVVPHSPFWLSADDTMRIVLRIGSQTAPAKTARSYGTTADAD